MKALTIFWLAATVVFLGVAIYFAIEWGDYIYFLFPLVSFFMFLRRRKQSRGQAK